MEPDLIKRLPVADPRTMLRALAQYAEKFSLWSIDRFEVTLLLHSGHVVSGQAARLGKDLDGECVLLYQGDEKEPALVYIRLSDVIAVRLNNPVIAARVFDERQQKAQQGDVPTRLQIKRHLEEANQKLKATHPKTPTIDCVWDSLGETPEERYSASELLMALPGILITLSSDALGTEALGKISTVLFKSTQGASLQATKSGSGIELTYDLRRALPDRLDESVKSVLEKVL